MRRFINNQSGKPAVQRRRSRSRRAGSASIDYFLVLAIIVPLAAFMTYAVPHIIQLVYEMFITMVGMPFM